MVRQEESIYICTALETDHDSPFTDRIFLKITDFPSALERLLKNFMRKPDIQVSNITSKPLPILPSIDTNSLVIQPSSIFESFIEDSTFSEEDESENYEYQQQFQYNNGNSEPVKSNSLPKSTKSNAISPKKSKKSEHPTSKSTSNLGNRQCLNCFCTSTPMWRRGPDGVASLCNACGVKFKAGKLQMSPEQVEINKKKIQGIQNRDNQGFQLQDQETFIIQNEELTIHQY